MSNTMWLSYKSPITNPYFEDLFVTLRDCFNSILANNNYRKQFNEITTTKYSSKKQAIVKKLKGDYQKEIKAITGNPLVGKIYQGGEFFNYICDNIIHLIVSHREQVLIYQYLKANNFKINDKLYRDFIADSEINNLPSHHYLKTLKNIHKTPEIPAHKKFIMDFSVDNHQGFNMDPHNLTCTLNLAPIAKLTKRQIKQGLTRPPFTDKVKDNAQPKQVTFQLYIPTYVRYELMTGKFAKPIISYNRLTHELICQIGYEVKLPEHKDFKNILGVDLGKVKVFSAVALFENKSFSPEYIPSKQLQKLIDRAENLAKHKQSVREKIERANSYNDLALPRTNRQRRRQLDLDFAKNKLITVKKEIAKLVAQEIVAVALQYKCKEIHVENLHWLLSQGGKWDYAEIQRRIELVAKLFGIKVIQINAQNTSHRHPFNHELGKAISRDIVFSDGTRYDRDHLAAMNIALIDKNNKIHKAKLKKNTTTRVKRQGRKSIIRNVVKSTFNDLCRKSQIVVFSYKQDVLSLITTTQSEISGLCNNIAEKDFNRFDRYQNISFLYNL